MLHLSFFIGLVMGLSTITEFIDDVTILNAVENIGIGYAQSDGITNTKGLIKLTALFN